MYVKGNAYQLILDDLTNHKLQQEHISPTIATPPFLAKVRAELASQAKSEADAIIAEIDKDSHVARVTVDRNLVLSLQTNPALLFIFRRFDPNNIGMIDYHGANRFYQRERLGGVNVNVDESQQRFAQHSLFDIQNKYTNIKGELASSFVRNLIAVSSGNTTDDDSNTIETLKEMFTLFFPGKTFRGPRALATGTLSFPIEIDGGAEHDIDDLSSGEKELVYGYLRLRNSSPRHSILLLDEPELHLNPRLIRGLPDFYKRHLGGAMDNQIWLVTHSDAFLREAVGREGFSVYHMTPPTTVDRTQNQATALNASSELEKTILAMVGDLASYRPGAKVVIFEGDRDTQFDVRMVSRLFPAIIEKFTLLSGSNRGAVVRLYQVLRDAIAAASIPVRIYAIVDRDGASVVDESAVDLFQWDAYHIENYLLETKYILKVLQDLRADASPLNTERGILTELKSCATACLPRLVAHELRSFANSMLVQCLNLRVNDSATDPAAELARGIKTSVERVARMADGQLNSKAVGAKRKEVETRLQASLSAEGWRQDFRGREILAEFAGRHMNRLGYEVLRELIISRMADNNFQPEGMRKVLTAIGAN